MTRKKKSAGEEAVEEMEKELKIEDLLKPYTVITSNQRVKVTLADEDDGNDASEIEGRLFGIDRELKVLSVQELENSGKGVSMVHIPLEAILYWEEGPMVESEPEGHDSEGEGKKKDEEPTASN